MACGCGCGGGCGKALGNPARMRRILKPWSWKSFQEGSLPFEAAKRVKATVTTLISGRVGLVSIEIVRLHGRPAVLIRYTRESALQGVPCVMQGVPIVARRVLA